MNSPLLQIKRLKKYFLRQQAFWQKWAGTKEYIYAVDGVLFRSIKAKPWALWGKRLREIYFGPDYSQALRTYGRGDLF